MHCSKEILTHIIVLTLEDRCCDSCFTDKEREAPRCGATSSRSRSWQAMDSGYQPRQQGSGSETRCLQPWHGGSYPPHPKKCLMGTGANPQRSPGSGESAYPLQTLHMVFHRPPQRLHGNSSFFFSPAPSCCCSF